MDGQRVAVEGEGCKSGPGTRGRRYFIGSEENCGVGNGVGVSDWGECEDERKSYRPGEKNSFNGRDSPSARQQDSVFA